MAKEVQTQAGQCSTLGTVQATREVPQMGFPFVVSPSGRPSPNTASCRQTQVFQAHLGHRPGRVEDRAAGADQQRGLHVGVAGGDDLQPVRQ